MRSTNESRPNEYDINRLLKKSYFYQEYYAGFKNDSVIEPCNSKQY